jgi:hypothetical protein
LLLLLLASATSASTSRQLDCGSLAMCVRPSLRVVPADVSDLRVMVFVLDVVVADGFTDRKPDRVLAARSAAPMYATSLS